MTLCALLRGVSNIPRPIVTTVLPHKLKCYAIPVYSAVKHARAKGVGCESAARVQIPLFPPKENPRIYSKMLMIRGFSYIRIAGYCRQVYRFYWPPPAAFRPGSRRRSHLHKLSQYSMAIFVQFYIHHLLTYTLISGILYYNKGGTKNEIRQKQNHERRLVCFQCK